jgi:L-fuconolactonase
MSPADARVDTVVDAHLHVWNPDTVHYPWLTHDLVEIDRPFGVEDAARELRAHGVGRVILVQSADNHADSELMLFQALAHPQVAGVVAWVPLTSPDDAAAQLDAWHSEPVVGIRHMVHREPDPDWLMRDDVGEGLDLLAARGLPFDVSAANPEQLAHIPVLADRHPTLVFVLDHLGSPPIAARRAGLRAQWDCWDMLIAEVAKAPNVVAKISGLTTSAGHGWTPADLQPAVERAFEVFGVERLMIGSDWPFSLLAADSYGDAWMGTRATLAQLTDEERAHVLSGTATRTYRLPVD